MATAQDTADDTAADATDPGSDLGSNLQQKPNMMQFLSDPRVRNGLLSFAAQALTGSWGSPISQVGQAMGHGLASAGETETIENQQEHQKAQMKQVKDIADEHNKTQIQVAQLHADTLKSITGMKTAAMQQRTQDPVWIKAYQTSYQNNLTTMDPGERAAQATAEANMAYEAHHAAIGQGSPANTSVPPAGTISPPAKKQVPPWAETAKLIDPTKFKTDPNYRDQLRKTYPAEVDKASRELGIPTGSTKQGRATDQLLDYLRPKGPQLGPNTTAPNG